jgi:hypothetical protein
MFPRVRSNKATFGITFALFLRLTTVTINENEN